MEKSQLSRTPKSERGKFTTPLVLNYLKSGMWLVRKPLTFKLGNGKEITVPVNFSTDLDSVPRIPFLYAWLKGRATKAAVVHDFLYFKKHNRKEADTIFYIAMREEGVPAWRRWPIYLGVRSFGWLYYVKN